MNFINIPSILKNDISLTEKTWFSVGGKAKLYAEIKDYEELSTILAWNNKTGKLPIHVLGLGANTLFPDEGFEGIVLKFIFQGISHSLTNETTGLLTASAGTAISETIDYSIDHNLFGLEEFSGIPSSVGGAFFINLHYYEFLIDRFVHSGTVCDLETGNIFKADRAWFEFSYDHSKLKENKKYILLDGAFELTRNDDFFKAYTRGRQKEIIRHRNNRYPHKNTCGCFFKNFNREDVPEIEGKRITAAGFYIDQCNLRGSTKIGHSFISSQHANMIIHDGAGKASEIITIAKIMQKAVFRKFNLLLEPECELIGFDTHPLYTKETISL